MSGFLASLQNDYSLQMARHRNRPFLKAVMAACSLAAVADGEVSFSERMRIDQILHDLFNGYSAAILASPKRGRKKALKAVQAVTQDPDTAKLLVRICLAVAEAKGEKGLIDQIEIVMLCTILGVEPKFAGLYTDGSSDALIRDA
jgi:tellurite resistance protein